MQLIHSKFTSSELKRHTKYALSSKSNVKRNLRNREFENQLLSKIITFILNTDQMQCKSLKIASFLCLPNDECKFLYLNSILEFFCFCFLFLFPTFLWCKSFSTNDVEEKSYYRLFQSVILFIVPFQIDTCKIILIKLI